MRLFEGTISDLPAQPSTGFVALLAKHRTAIDPSFNLRAGKLALHALARAIIEALGGKQGNDGWEVDLSVFDLDVTLGAANQKVEALEARVAELEELLTAVPKLNGGELQGLVENLRGAMMQQEQVIASLLSRLERLESPAPRKRQQKSEEASKSEEAPTE